MIDPQVQKRTDAGSEWPACVLCGSGSPENSNSCQLDGHSVGTWKLHTSRMVRPNSWHGVGCAMPWRDVGTG